MIIENLPIVDIVNHCGFSRFQDKIKVEAMLKIHYPLNKIWSSL